MKPRDAALEYVDRGLAVYPLWFNLGQDGKWKKIPHIRRWNKERAARTSEQVNEYWDEFPNAQVGLVLDGLNAVDIDPRNHGNETFRGLCSDIGLEVFDGCPISDTASGGQHFLFTARQDKPQGSGTNKLGKGIDFAGNNAGLAVFPSVRPDGGAYVWRTPNGEMPDFSNAPVLPDPLIQRLGKNKAERVAREAVGRMPSVLLKGNRNQGLFLMLLRLRQRSGLSGDELLAVAGILNKTRVTPRLPESEVREIVNSVSKYNPTTEDAPLWLHSWLPCLRGQELRVATAYCVIAEFDCQSALTPSAELVEQRTGGMRHNHYLEARAGLVKKQAIRVYPRPKGQAPLIELLLNPTNANPYDFLEKAC